MAELALVLSAVGIAQNIVSVMNGCRDVIDLICGIQKAPIEAKHIANQLETSTAVLTAIKSSLDSVQRSPDFLRKWGASAHLVLTNINATISQISGKLSKRGFFGKKVQWNYEKRDALVLQQTLQSYMQMLAMVQNALLQENMRTLQDSNERIRRTIEGSSKSVEPVDNYSIEPTTLSSIDTGGDVVLPGGKKIKELASWPVDDFHVGRLNGSSGLAEVQRGNVKHEVRTALGKGKVTFTLNDNRTQLWITYRPEKAKVGESRWYHSLNANQFKLEFVTDYDARCKAAHSSEFFHSDEKYYSSRMGTSTKGVFLFIAGLQADTKGQYKYGDDGNWAIEILLKPQSRNMKLLRALANDVDIASKKKAAAEWAARQTKTKRK